MAQHLYLVRHAEAIPRGTLDPDVNRWLTERGRRRFYRAARRFAKEVGQGRGCAIDAILTSPAPRAVQTAELLGRALRLRGPIEVVPELAPEAEVGPAAERLRREARVVAAVGHEPQLAQLLRALCGGAAEAPQGPPDGAADDKTNGKTDAAMSSPPDAATSGLPDALPDSLPDSLKKGAIAHLRTRDGQERARLRAIREP